MEIDLAVDTPSCLLFQEECPLVVVGLHFDDDEDGGTWEQDTRATRSWTCARVCMSSADRGVQARDVPRFDGRS